MGFGVQLTWPTRGSRRPSGRGRRCRGRCRPIGKTIPSSAAAAEGLESPGLKIRVLVLDFVFCVKVLKFWLLILSLGFGIVGLGSGGLGFGV